MGSAAANTAARRVRFGDVVRLCTDRGADPVAEDIERYVGLEHLEPGDLRIRRWGLVTEGTTFTNRFKPGQVLFGKRRAYQRKVAVAHFEGVCSGDIYVLEPANGSLHPQLLPFLCQTAAFYEHAVGTSAGSLSPRTNWKSLADFEFVLPAIENQRKIAAALAAASKTTEQLSDAVDHGQRLIRSLLHEHFARQFRLAERGSDRCRAYAFGEVLNVLKDGTHNPSRDRADDGPVLLSVTHLDGDRLSYGDNEARVSWAFYERERRRLDPRPGDALLATIGFSLGKTGTVQQDMPPFVLQRMVAVLRADPAKLEQAYLRAFLDCPLFQRQLWARAKQTQQPAIYLGELAAIRIPVAAMATQREFIGTFQSVRSSLHRLRIRHASARELGGRLASELL